MISRPITKINFNPNLKIFKTPQWEQKLYKKIKIEKWKVLIPDFGNMVKFKKKVDMSNVKNAEFYLRFFI